MATYVKNQLYMVPLAELQPDPAQPRKYMDPVALDKLMASIGQVGNNRDNKFINIKDSKGLGVFLCVVIFILHLSLLLSNNALADMNEEIRKCAAEGDNVRRLECYDKLAEQNKPAKVAAPTDLGEDSKPTLNHYISIMEKHWNLDAENRTNTPLIQWHHPTYFLFGAYNNSPNRDMTLDVDPRAKAQNTEAIFQLSGKVRPLPDDLLGKHFDLWFGYTQRSFWQLYNSAFSSPFRDTNFEPEGFITFHDNYDLFGLNLLNWRIVNVGFAHKSNGRARPLSRSWNRLFAEFGFEKVLNRNISDGDRNEFNLFLKPWYRLPEDGQNDDNPDIEKYLGYGEIWGVYYWQKHRFALMLRNNLRANNNKGALQLDWSFPMPLTRFTSDKISVYVQYFNGYGESLLDYNSSSNRISAGIMLTNWGR